MSFFFFLKMSFFLVWVNKKLILLLFLSDEKIIKYSFIRTCERRPDATDTLHRVVKTAWFTTVGSSFLSSSSLLSLSLSVSFCHLTCWGYRYSNNSSISLRSPLSGVCLDSKELIRISRFDSNRTSPNITDKRGGGWRIRAWWWWHKSWRRRWRIGGRRLTSQLSGKMGSSSLSLVLMLLSPPSLLYVHLSLSLSQSPRL